ncbi:MAG TPA: carbon-nitrogen hydrolase family protein [Candidatus Thermoplasmatota archaeon]|nr:carbon-nitrogen hydrolase family protein [Candidatus Thermoplasmatota archaeon]
MRFKAAVVQMDCVSGDRAANAAKAMTLVRQAASQGARLIVLPEMFNTGYLPHRAKELAETMRSATLGDLAALAAKRDVWIAGAMLERGEDGRFYDTAFLVSGVGVAATYRKVHLWDAEKAHLAPGSRIAQWNCRLGTMGPLVCHDLEYPEQAAAYPPLGARYLVAPSAFFTAELWERVTVDRARETGCYLLAANRVGGGEAEGGRRFCGRSRVVDPHGKVLVDAGDQEGVFLAEMDPEVVQNLRKARAGVPG